MIYIYIHYFLLLQIYDMYMFVYFDVYVTYTVCIVMDHVYSYVSFTYIHVCISIQDVE